MDINIIYEDNHLLVVEKPVNVLTQGDITGDRDLLTILKEDIKIRYKKPGNVYLGLVHRIDRPTGGIIIFAKTSKAASRLSKQIRDGRFKKIYLAVVYGTFYTNKGRMEHYLEKNRSKNKVYIINNVTEDTKENVIAKKSILEYEVLDHVGGLNLIKINLITGRSHQVRVQFTGQGYPLFGDRKYNEKLSKPGEQLALWSHSIEFIHPTKQEKIILSCNPPPLYPWNIFGNILFKKN